MFKDGDQDDCGGKDATGHQGNSGDQLRPASAVTVPKGVEPIQASVDQDETDNPGKQISESVRRFARYSKIVTAVIALAAVVQAVTSYYQWDATNKQWQVMQDDQRPWSYNRKLWMR